VDEELAEAGNDDVENEDDDTEDEVVETRSTAKVAQRRR
jgi:hypothetical protein